MCVTCKQQVHNLVCPLLQGPMGREKKPGPARRCITMHYDAAVQAGEPPMVNLGRNLASGMCHLQADLIPGLALCC